MSSGDQEFYDQAWVAWRDMQRYAPAPRYLRRVVLREISGLHFGSVLDMGCGEGSLLEMIGKAHPNVSLAGSELSPIALSYCKKRLPRADLFPLDILKGDVAGKTYDLIVSVQVLEHLEDDLLALERLRKMCRSYLLISVPGGTLDEHARGLGHHRHYTAATLTEKMERAGFVLRRVFTCGWPIHSVLYRRLVRHLPQEMVKSAGLGAYGRKRRVMMGLLDLAYRLNLSFVGTEVFALGVPRDRAPGSVVEGSEGPGS